MPKFAWMSTSSLENAFLKPIAVKTRSHVSKYKTTEGGLINGRHVKKEFIYIVEKDGHVVKDDTIGMLLVMGKTKIKGNWRYSR